MFAAGVGLMVGTAVDGAVIGIVFTIIWLGFVCRLALAGLWVSDKGLRYRGLLHTVTIPWSGVRCVRLAPFRWALPTATAQAVWIDRVDQAPLQTWMTDKGIDFIWRKQAFQEAFRAIEAAVEAHRGRHIDHT